MNANIKKTQIFHIMKFDPKGNQKSLHILTKANYIRIHVIIIPFKNLQILILFSQPLIVAYIEMSFDMDYGYSIYE